MPEMVLPQSMPTIGTARGFGLSAWNRSGVEEKLTVAGRRPERLHGHGEAGADNGDWDG